MFEIECIDAAFVITRVYDIYIVKKHSYRNFRPNSSACCIIIVWNSLPQLVINAAHVVEFKHLLFYVDLARFLHCTGSLLVTKISLVSELVKVSSY